MEKKVLEYVKNETENLLKAPSACKEVKEMATKWKNSIGGADELLVAKEYIKELEEDIEGIDDLVAFACSPVAEKVFGKEGAEGFKAHALELKKSGAKYCDCPACTACYNILSKKDEILK